MKEGYQEIIRYLIVGVLTTVVSLAVYYGCVLTILDPEQALELQAANVISWIAAVTFAYIANRIFVFRSKSRAWFREARAFVCARIATLLMDMAIMFVLVTVCHYNDKIAKLVVQVVVTVANYILSKVLVFRNR
ncbi:MAG: GtrA family protein [Clostridiales bacterium]|nr:GtrA family protein [Clostridiales bacterium]